MSDPMSDDLPDRARDRASRSYVACNCHDTLHDCADRIDELEAALREIAKGKHVDPFGNILNQPSREAIIARRALEADHE